jgi:hypothetical protein
MTDMEVDVNPPATSTSASKTKSGDKESKKRFEVKKVSYPRARLD